MNYDLNRFIKAQEFVYNDVLEELNNGLKRSHWIWYIFPQLNILGQSYDSRYYGISSLEEAKEYMKDNILRSRYIECCKVLKKHSDKNIKEILGNLDAMKLNSSLTLFSFVDFEGNEIIKDLLDIFYNGNKCEITINFLNNECK